MNSYLKHIRKFHMCAPMNPNNEAVEVEGVDVQDSDQESDQDNQEIGEQNDDQDYFETFDELSLKRLAASLIVKLRSAASVTLTTIDKVISGTKEIIGATVQALSHHTLNVLRNHGVDPNAADVQELTDKFRAFENPFTGLETQQQQMTFMIEKLYLVKPIERALGTRIDRVVDRKSGDTIQKVVTETFQYIPVLDVLRLVLNDKVHQLVHNEKKSPQGFYTGFQDGELMMQHGFLIEHPKTLRLQLYYDDVEVVNPLGSKTGTHKLGLFYYSIQNLPHHYNASMNSVFVLAVCYSADLKKYGFDPILDPFVKEMKKLEADTGVEIINTAGNLLNVHGTLVSLSADSLAAHELLGFMSPSANLLCRLCKATRAAIQEHFLEDLFEPRTIEDHDLACEIAMQRHGDPATGVRSQCLLNSLRCFHCTTNHNLDVMHDLLEGVCPYEVKLILHQFIFNDHFISLRELNQRLKAFQYGFTDRKNKPTALSHERMTNQNDRKLGQKASQMWCLIRMLPLCR